MPAPTNTPDRIYDGDLLSSATQDGPGWFTLPFQDQGDTQSFEYHAYFTIHSSVYTAYRNSVNFVTGFVPRIESLYSISTARGTAYLVHEDAPENMNTTGWYRFLRTYASVPITRYEGTSLVYSRQFLSTHADYTWTTPPAAPEVAEWPVQCKGWRKYEYFLGSYPAMIYAPKVNVVFGTILYSPFASVSADDGGWPPSYTKAFVAQDSDIRNYKGSMIERSTLYAVWPTTGT